MSQILSQTLKRLRTEKNYTQEEAARILGVTAQTISRWECNITLPDVMLLPEIAKLYCVTIDDLFMNTFLGLPTECLADLNALISFSESS